MRSPPSDNVPVNGVDAIYKHNDDNDDDDEYMTIPKKHLTVIDAGKSQSLIKLAGSLVMYNSAPAASMVFGGNE